MLILGLAVLAVVHSVATQGQASKFFGDVFRGMGQLFKSYIPGGGCQQQQREQRRVGGGVDDEDMDFDDEDMDFYTDTSFDVKT